MVRCYYRTWNEGNFLWIQQVSSTPATRLDVIALQEELDKRLKQRKARDSGICPVRRELYTECFGLSLTFKVVYFKLIINCHRNRIFFISIYQD